LAHSSAVAISTGRTSARRAVRRAAARCARPSARRAAAIASSFTWGTIARAPVWALASRPGRALTIFSVALAADDNFSAANHFPVHPLDDALGIGRGDFDERVALAQIDLPNVIARNAAFASDRAHEIADFYSIASADRHEEACHS
jgi:hypothetical protein